VMLPTVAHDLSDKELFQNHFTVGRMHAVLGRGHRCFLRSSWISACG
jgi:hypothetical protein